MRALIMLIALASPAFAQPVSFQLKGEVPVGKKPQLQITATQPVTDLRIDLERDDGKKFSMKEASLAKGKAKVFDVGDGAAGKASYKGTISAMAGGQKWSDQMSFDTRTISISTSASCSSSCRAARTPPSSP